MEYSSVVHAPPDAKLSVLIQVVHQGHGWVYGQDAYTGDKVAFTYEGDVGGYMTLYLARKTSRMIDDFRVLELNSNWPPMFSRTPQKVDLMYAHDVCAGVGGFATALSFLGGTVLTAVDFSALACEAHGLNHNTTCIQADLHDDETVMRMHVAQEAAGVQGSICAGFPCQPYSKQGDQRRELDGRSRTLPAVLRSACLLHSGCLVLECVPEVMTDGYTQRCLAEFVALTGFRLVQHVTHLHSVWPSRRSRWFGVLLHPSFAELELVDLPTLCPQPTVGDFMPFEQRPVWDLSEESQLEWTPIEQQVYTDPEFGPVDRRVVTNQPLPTALHSWSVALTACPCGCRQTGLSADRLRSAGLRGIAIVSGLWPNRRRHIHPRELQWFLGFPPFQQILADCRAQNCLFGNSASPIQCLWTLAHVLDAQDMLWDSRTPTAILADYVEYISNQREVSWPMVPAIAKLTLRFADSSVEVAFQSPMKVGDLIKAEAALHGAQHVTLTCDGIALPSHAYLQAREYQVYLQGQDTLDKHYVSFTLEMLGMSHAVLVPACFTFAQALKWLGLGPLCSLVDHEMRQIDLCTQVSSGGRYTLQADADDTFLDLALRHGFGHLSGAPLACSETRGDTGLWHVDEVLRSQLLLTWFAADYPLLKVWLPSFTTAALEDWPAVFAQHVTPWILQDDEPLYAFVLEHWGWTLVKCEIQGPRMDVTLFAPRHMLPRSSRLVRNVFGVSQCVFTVQTETSQAQVPSGTLQEVLSMLDADVGLSVTVVGALFEVRSQHFASFPETSPLRLASVDFHLPRQLPISADSQSDTSSDGPCPQGISASFLLHAAKTWTLLNPSTISPCQVRVVCIGTDVFSVGRSFDFCEQDGPPVFVFALVDSHWVLLHCAHDAGSLKITVYDGLAHVRLFRVSGLCMQLKQMWKASNVHITMTWTVPQNQPHSCGTVALAHFALLSGLISLEQALHFESCHDGFVVCGLARDPASPIGYGVDEKAMRAALEHILVSKGVPQNSVADRITGAIKAFGLDGH
eukprot:Skav212034  [mRNA]  locus=scaffold1285:166111:169349:+ [translate_table: standard]